MRYVLGVSKRLCLRPTVVNSGMNWASRRDCQTVYCERALAILYSRAFGLKIDGANEPTSDFFSFFF